MKNGENVCARKEFLLKFPPSFSDWFNRKFLFCSPMTEMKLTRRSREFNCHQGTEISSRVHIRVEEGWKTSSWVIVDVAQNFPVGSILAATRHPHLIPMCLRELLDVGPQVIRHVVRQIVRIVEILGRPSENSVQLQKDARRWVVVTIRMACRAQIELANIQLANLAFVGKRLEVAVLLIVRAHAVL